MPNSTPVYGWPYLNRSVDPLTYEAVSGEDYLLAIEGTVSSVDTRVAAAEADINTLETAVDRSKVIDAIQTNVAVVDTTSGTTEKNLSRLVSGNLVLDTTELYRTDIQVITTRTAASDEYEFRLRQTTALSGTVVGSAIAWGVNATAGRYVRASILWVPAASATTTVHLSVIRNAGTGTVSVFYTNFGQIVRTQVVHSRVGLASTLRTISV